MGGFFSTLVSKLAPDALKSVSALEQQGFTTGAQLASANLATEEAAVVQAASAVAAAATKQFIDEHGGTQAVLDAHTTDAAALATKVTSLIDAATADAAKNIEKVVPIIGNFDGTVRSLIRGAVTQVVTYLLPHLEPIVTTTPAPNFPIVNLVKGGSPLPPH